MVWSRDSGWTARRRSLALGLGRPSVMGLGPVRRSSGDTILAIAEDEALEEGAVVDCWDTFNLSRRPVKVREWLNEGAGENPLEPDYSL